MVVSAKMWPQSSGSGIRSISGIRLDSWGFALIRWSALLKVKHGNVRCHLEERGGKKVCGGRPWSSSHPRRSGSGCKSP